MIDYFAERAAEWDKPGKIKMSGNFVNALLSRVELQAHWRGLEVGAGTGLVGLQILPSIRSLVCVDTSEAMLQVLKEKTVQLPQVDIIHGEVNAYDQPDIDFVFSNMSFHHIEDIPQTLAHLYRITTPGALLAIGDIRTEDGSFHRFNAIPHKGFDTDELSAWVEAAGFNVRLVETYQILEQEKIPGRLSKYEQFILLAVRNL